MQQTTENGNNQEEQDSPLITIFSIDNFCNNLLKSNPEFISIAMEFNFELDASILLVVFEKMLQLAIFSDKNNTTNDLDDFPHLSVLQTTLFLQLVFQLVFHLKKCSFYN